ncbi:hypothetical protein [Streptomyces sp. NPDC056524]|uniref:hypothetical protein n=1 Tax=Streptomyces sp. NPDC056524 TaxID=3345851 RepID=UPI0036B38441
MRLCVPGLDAVLGWIWAIGTAAGLGTVATVTADELHQPTVSLTVSDAGTSYRWPA